EAEAIQRLAEARAQSIQTIARAIGTKVSNIFQYIESYH
ncbi:unnamed protein product, partial [Schistosoma curassoni]|uniref:HTH_7 domain-containing protein n=1 Tax=Schistosoma curassoni TaxID=6186 RepID=A0A183JST1_9TREM